MKRPEIGTAAKFWVNIFKALIRLEAVRNRSPKLFYVLSHLIGYLLFYSCAHLVGADKIPNPTWWPSWLFFLPFSTLVKIILVVPLSLVVTQLVVGGLLPVLSYAPQAIAMKRLGLYSVTDDVKEYINTLKHCVESQDPKEKVKVICITGEHLFREDKLPGMENVDCPLHKLAREGKLDVVMPKSDVQNRTIRLRFDTYDNDFRVNHGFLQIEDYIQNHIKPSKVFLHHYHNEITEHDVGSLWRAVIFTKYCVIQFYYPNNSGSESFKSPLIVFEKVDHKSVNSFYETVCKQFDLLKHHPTSHALVGQAP